MNTNYGRDSNTFYGLLREKIANIFQVKNEYFILFQLKLTFLVYEWKNNIIHDYSKYYFLISKQFTLSGLSPTFLPSLMMIKAIYEPWEQFLITMATVVKETGPKYFSCR